MWYLLTCLSISYQIAFLFIYSTFAAKYLNSLDEKETAIYDKLINKPSNDWYCEIIINRGFLIFADFVVHLNHENKNPTK
jgi:hypothetical protein